MYRSKKRIRSCRTVVNKTTKKVRCKHVIPKLEDVKLRRELVEVCKVGDSC